MTVQYRWLRLGLYCLSAVAIGACEAGRACPTNSCGTMVITTGAEADVLMPVSTQMDVGQSLNDLIFDKLADVGMSMNTMGDVDFVPRLADSWSFIDPATIEFTIHADAKWHDGTPVTADDVAFSFAVYTDPLVGASAAPRLQRIESVTAPDPRTVTFRFRRAYPEQFFDAVYHMWILPKHILDTVPRERLSAHPFGRDPIGSGPYRFVRWTTAEFVELTHNEAYHLGPPGIPRLVWRFSADAGASLTEVLAGEADVLSQLPGPEALARVLARDDLDLYPYALPGYAFIGFNQRDPRDLDRPHPLFSDVGLRRALTAAIDIELVVLGAVGELGRVAPGPVTPLIGIDPSDLPVIDFDRDLARRSLEDMGWDDTDGDGVLDRDGLRLSFEVIVPTSSRGRIRAAQIVQEQLRQIGVRMEIAEYEFTAWDDRTSAGRFDATFGAFGQDPGRGFLADTWTTDAIGALNTVAYSNVEVDQLIADAQITSDGTAADRLRHQAVAALIEDAPAIWIYIPDQRVTVHHRIRNVTIRPDMWTATIPSWSIDPRMYIERDLAGQRE